MKEPSKEAMEAARAIRFEQLDPLDSDVRDIAHALDAFAARARPKMARILEGWGQYDGEAHFFYAGVSLCSKAKGGPNNVADAYCAVCMEKLIKAAME